MVYDFDAINRQAETVGSHKGVMDPKADQSAAHDRNVIQMGLHALTGGSAVEERLTEPKH